MKNGLYLILGLLVAGVLMFTFLPLEFSMETDAERAPGQTVERIYFGPRQSLAVLPPGNAAPLPDRAWLADGLAIDLVDRLAAEPGLQVLSPNSSFFFKGQQVEPRIIAERLRARHLLFLQLGELDGTLQVSAIVHDARNERDVFESEYSMPPGQWSELVSQLKADVMEAMNVASRGRDESSAIDAAWFPYLQAKVFMRESRFQQARASFLRSIEADPAFVAARVGLAQSALLMPDQSMSQASPVDTALAELDAALAIDPENGLANGLKAHLLYRYQWAFASAMASAQRAVAALPGDPVVLSVAASAALSLGEFEKSVEWLIKAIDRDPLNLLLRLALGHAQEYAGDYDNALSTYRQAIILNPDIPGAAAFRARIKLLQDKPDVALTESDEEPDPFWARYARILALHALDRGDEVQPLLDAMITEDGHRAAYQVAEIQAFRNDTAQAFAWLETALRQRDGGMAEIAGNRFFAGLHDDPRWSTLLEQLGLPLLDSAVESD